MKRGVKPLIKKMGRSEIEDLCPRKNWSLVDFKTAVEHFDDIPYDSFWIDGYEDSYGEMRPLLAYKKEGELFFETCSPNFFQYCVVIKNEETKDTVYSKVTGLLEDRKNILNTDDSFERAKIEEALSIISNILEQ